MYKKVILLLVSLCLTLSISFGQAQVLEWIYHPEVTVNGYPVSFDQKPLIFNGRVILPIRAVCERIGAEVDWNAATQTSTVKKGEIQLELVIGSKVMHKINANQPPQRLALDTAPLVIHGRTLLPLRAVVEALGYTLSWDAAKWLVTIVEEQVLAVGDLVNTQVDSVERWARIGAVHQFAYRDLGLGYAYVKENELIVKTPEQALRLQRKYPLLGDVIADDFGNIYVVWGFESEKDATPVENTFISKYSPSGQLIQSTGFVGASSPWGDSDAAKTRRPFYAGNCVSVIANGMLINYHGKLRYDGHQSDQVIGVYTDSMAPVSLPNTTFTGHSFNQSIVHYKKSDKVYFASQGDAFPRGFKVNDQSGRYGQQEKVLFHFFMPQNANYDMRIVNETYAQLGGLVEVQDALALVGASAKSLSANAAKEPQNLFIQIFNPEATKESSQFYKGGTDRTGETAFDIYDTKSTPMKPVIDQGIHWLTNYTDREVIAPQVVVAENRIVILWSEKYGSSDSYSSLAPRDNNYYMVLSSSGEVIKAATSLGHMPLNSMERPVYHEGHLQWVTVYNGYLKVRQLKL